MGYICIHPTTKQFRTPSSCRFSTQWWKHAWSLTGCYSLRVPCQLPLSLSLPYCLTALLPYLLPFCSVPIGWGFSLFTFSTPGCGRISPCPTMYVRMLVVFLCAATGSRVLNPIFWYEIYLVSKGLNPFIGIIGGLESCMWIAWISSVDRLNPVCLRPFQKGDLPKGVLNQNMHTLPTFATTNRCILSNTILHYT